MHYLQLIRGNYKGFKDSSESKKDNPGILGPSSPTKLEKNHIFLSRKYENAKKKIQA
jgi:hypothetical protein